MSKPSIVIADDHVLVLEGFRKLLETHFDVVAAVEDGRAAIRQASKLKPDIVLLDISMPLLNGLDAAKILKRKSPRSKIVFLSMHSDPEIIVKAFQAGACGYLLKRSAGSELVFSLKEILKGGFYVTPMAANALVEEIKGPDKSQVPHIKSKCDNLTVRQREVLQLVAEGYSAKEIASALDISAKTVEYHKTQIMDLLNIHTIAQLTRYAIAQNIVSIE
jgi:DNA-binding NarL/FixJ family response regulator